MAAGVSNTFIGDPALARGCDVSHHNGPVDFQDLAAHDLSFVILKCADGAFNTDDTYARNRRDAERAGLLTAPYLFVRATHDPIKQVGNLIAHMGNLSKPIPPVLDLEWDKNNPQQPDKWQLLKTQKERAEVVGALMVEIKYRLGVLPMVYTAFSFFDATFGQITKFGGLNIWDCLLWTVDVNPKYKEPRLPFPWRAMGVAWDFRQCGIGQVGKASPLDLNVFNGTVAELKALEL